jgi:hypothetical protein
MGVAQDGLYAPRKKLKKLLFVRGKMKEIVDDAIHRSYVELRVGREGNAKQICSVNVTPTGTGTEVNIVLELGNELASSQNLLRRVCKTIALTSCQQHVGETGGDAESRTTARRLEPPPSTQGKTTQNPPPWGWR